MDLILIFIPQTNVKLNNRRETDPLENKTKEFQKNTQSFSLLVTKT